MLISLVNFSRTYETHIFSYLNLLRRASSLGHPVRSVFATFRCRLKNATSVLLCDLFIEHFLNDVNHVACRAGLKPISLRSHLTPLLTKGSDGQNRSWPAGVFVAKLLKELLYQWKSLHMSKSEAYKWYAVSELRHEDCPVTCAVLHEPICCPPWETFATDETAMMMMMMISH